MKKTILFFALTAILGLSNQAFAQKKSSFNYRVGIASSLPVDVYGDSYRVGIGSSFYEISYALKNSKKVSLTFNTAFIRLINKEATFTNQVPVMVGAKYMVNPDNKTSNIYFGAAAGTTTFTKKSMGSTGFAFSPYVGVQVKHISIDGRYLNFNRNGSSTRTVALVFSYTL
jgi:hypothetical protein